MTLPAAAAKRHGLERNRCGFVISSLKSQSADGLRVLIARLTLEGS
jgi:hypothetical protein